MWVVDIVNLVLTNLGEKMSDEEVDELLKAVDTSSGEINYTGMLTTTIVCCPQTLLIELAYRTRPNHSRQLTPSTFPLLHFLSVLSLA